MAGNPAVGVLEAFFPRGELPFKNLKLCLNILDLFSVGCSGLLQFRETGKFLLLLGYLGKKKYAKEDEYGNALHDANGNEIIDYTRNKKGFWRVASLIPAVAAVIAFVLTENMRLPMIMVDRWTLLMVIIAVVQLIVAVLCKKKKESEEDENQANA